ncbi:MULTISPECIES: hypothetical protein [unclassified Oceanispirochaeta]|uniref:hypothetical protein n=1 Tax=unclassified Oceanispirochaeta TaxID=2635722 RepID=UPI0018A976F9|nr:MULTISPECIES: hypothetical protein [unclassified Oceanispirochaeta]MBF9018761.1 hypothetical protein [Oceanispirochaeta sp. M2]
MGKEKKNTKKTNKVPKIFRKKIKIKKWEKKILKSIHIPSDRKWIVEHFELIEDRMVLKKDLPKDDLKKLKVLGKSIKKNKGAVTKWKAMILLFLAAVTLIFNSFFKNVLIKKGIEVGIESLFQASGNVQNPDLSLNKGSFTLDALSVQNKDKPGRNLFELGNTALRINMPELSRNRYHIEEISFEGVQFNSSSDLALQPESSAGDSKEGSSLMDIPDLEQSKEQILALIEEQKANLKTLQYIDTANKELDEFTERWTDTFNGTKGKVEDSVTEITALGKKGIPPITSINDARDVLDEYQGYYKGLEDQKKELEGLNRQFNEEKDHILSLKDEIEALIQGDIDYLKDLLQLPDRDEVRDFISDKIKEMLIERFQDYYDKAMLVMPYYEKWKNSQDGKVEEKKETKRLAGRYIPFPTADQPRFLIKNIKLNGGDGFSGLFHANVSGISSEPDKLDDPILLTADWGDGKTSIDLEGFLDLKEGAPQLFNVNFNSPANPAVFKNGIPALGIDSARAKMTYHGNGIPHPDKEGVLVSLDMDFRDLEISLPDNDDIGTRLIKETVQEIKEFLVSAEIHIDNNGIQNIRVNSDVDKIIKEKLGDLLKRLPAEGAEELESYLRELVSKELLDSNGLTEKLDALGLESLSQIRSIEDLEAQVKEYENKIRNQGDALLKDVEDKARAEAEKLKAEADAAKKAAEEKAAAAAAKAKAEADAAKKAAEEKAKQEAEKAAGNLKLPGF